MSVAIDRRAEIQLQPTPDQYSYLTPIQLEQLAETESKKIIRDEIILIDLVDREESIIDDNHARQLSESFGQYGQMSPILACPYINEEGILRYRIADGFHRTEGRILSGETTVRATCAYGFLNEEVYDLRILAASSVKSVQFPRIAEWITKSYASSPFAVKGLSVVQVFAIALNDSSRARSTNLTKDEVQELKEWARAKCLQWGKTVSSTYQILRIVNDADPNLVRQVRNSGGGKDRSAKITPDRLKHVVSAFPGPTFFAAQRGILRFVLEKRFSAQETADWVANIKNQLDPSLTEEEIYQAVVAFDKQNLLATDNIPSPKSTNLVEEEPTDDDLIEVQDWTTAFTEDESELTDDDGLRDNSDDDLEIEQPTDPDLVPFDVQLEATKSTIVFDSHQNRPHPRNGRSVKSTYGKKEVLNSHELGGGDIENIGALKARITDLERALIMATNQEPQSDTWWRTAVYLTPQERYSMEEVIFNNNGLDMVARELKVTQQVVLTYIQSAFAKRRIVKEEEIEKSKLKK